MLISKKICQGLSDREIIQKSLVEVDFFSCLYERYEDQLLRYVRRISGATEQEAEDVLQEAFIKIWKNLHAFDQSLKLSTWLYRIVHNQAISYLRKKKSFGKDKKEPLEEERYINVPDEQEVAGPEFLEAQDQLVHDILDQLPLNYKEVMLLKFLEDMSYQEISDVLKIPEGAVATRINRAKKAFRKLMDQQKKERYETF